MGVSIVVRDHAKFFMGVVVKQEACDIFVLAIELLTLNAGYEFTRNGYFHPLIVESNCLQAINLITSGESCFTADGVTVVEIGQMMPQMGIAQVIHKPS